MRKTITKIATALCAVSLAFSVTACSAERSGTTPSTATGETPSTTTGQVIGVSMPTKSLERWNRDGAYLQKLLTEQGYKVSLQYADNKVEQQISQIQNLINDGPAVLVVASIDGSALAPVLEEAQSKGIKVIAYDRLIRDTEAIDYYATFDNYKVGQMQGNYLVDTLGLKDGKGPFNFEPFSGSPDDNNARFFFAGAWDVLKPYVDSGKLVIPSGKNPGTVDNWQSIGIQAWQSKTAQDEMENRLNSFYNDKKVDVILSPNDSLALGISQALESAGYTPGDNYPLLTGQDADQANVQNLLAGKQAMTVWKDTRELGKQVAQMVVEIVQNKDVTVNDTKTYDNGKKVVPSFLIDPVVVTKDNVTEKLVDSEFYSKSDLGIK